MEHSPQPLKQQVTLSSPSASPKFIEWLQSHGIEALQPRLTELGFMSIANLLPLTCFIEPQIRAMVFMHPSTESLLSKHPNLSDRFIRAIQSLSDQLPTPPHSESQSSSQKVYMIVSREDRLIINHIETSLQLSESLTTDLRSIQSTIEGLEYQSLLNQQFSPIEHKIKSTFSTLIQLLQSKQDELLEQWNAIRNETAHRCIEAKQSMIDHQSELTAVLTKCSQWIDTQSVDSGRKNVQIWTDNDRKVSEMGNTIRNVWETDLPRLQSDIAALNAQITAQLKGGATSQLAHRFLTNDAITHSVAREIDWIGMIVDIGILPLPSFNAEWIADGTVVCIDISTDGVATAAIVATDEKTNDSDDDIVSKTTATAMTPKQPINEKLKLTHFELKYWYTVNTQFIPFDIGDEEKKSELQSSSSSSIVIRSKEEYRYVTIDGSLHNATVSVQKIEWNGLQSIASLSQSPPQSPMPITVEMHCAMRSVYSFDTKAGSIACRSQLSPIQRIKIPFAKDGSLIVRNGHRKILKSNYRYEFASVRIESGGVLSVEPWTPEHTNGGHLSINCHSTFIVAPNASIDVSERGYVGGKDGYCGYSHNGDSNQSFDHNFGGGGGGNLWGFGAGGGGHGTNGARGSAKNMFDDRGTVGSGGETYGDSQLRNELYLGSGGGGCNNVGGSGGGVIDIKCAKDFVNKGIISSNGGDGNNGSGGGSGGSIRLIVGDRIICGDKKTSAIVAVGGKASGGGGDGGKGRISFHFKRGKSCFDNSTLGTIKPKPHIIV